MYRLSAFIAFISLAASQANAQYDNKWVTFAKDPNGTVTAAAISDADNETDLAAGDLDLDGFIDLVVVRKQPFTSSGKRNNLLLMNVAGVLIDKTAQFAIRADVPGDQGFLTPTNDRDVVVDDVDQDGWLDVVTCTTLSDGDPKHIGHPRVYRNLSNGAAGWQGLRFENGRFPQLFHFVNGQPQNPRFCAVTSGDTTGDGYPDLYFGDYDSSGAGGSTQPPSSDLNDRYLVNDGFGFFQDLSQQAMPPQALLSAFNMAVDMADFNGDGVLDIVKDTALNAPQYVAILYNNPVTVGTFFAPDVVSQFSPYHVRADDLNGDGRTDLVIQDDNTDRYRINTGVGPLGTATWGPAKVFDFLNGNDDGFGGNIEIADLDGDGFRDVLIADTNADIAGFNRRLHIYHNLAVLPGAIDLKLREERQQFSDAGWIGVNGMTADDQRGTYDVIAIDLENDGDLDLVISRKDGTEVWRNQSSSQIVCQQDLGFGNGGTHVTVCGGDLSSGTTATLELTGAVPNVLAWLVVGTTSAPTYVPELQSTLIPLPPAVILTLATDFQGHITFPVQGGGGPLPAYIQFVTGKTVSTFDVSNAVLVQLQP